MSWSRGSFTEAPYLFYLTLKRVVGIIIRMRLCDAQYGVERISHALMRPLLTKPVTPLDVRIHASLTLAASKERGHAQQAGTQERQ